MDNSIDPIESSEIGIENNFPETPTNESTLEIIGTGDNNHNNDEDSDDEEEGVVIHAGRVNSTRKTPQHKSFGSKSYQRPQSVTSKEASTSAMSSINIDRIDEEDIKKLRFSRHVSAFDIDLDALDEQPWRNRNVDLLDYFNYGFNERTWKQYCEKQLKLRAKMGFGPHSLITSLNNHITNSQVNAVVMGTATTTTTTISTNSAEVTLQSQSEQTPNINKNISQEQPKPSVTTQSPANPTYIPQQQQYHQQQQNHQQQNHQQQQQQHHHQQQHQQHGHVNHMMPNQMMHHHQMGLPPPNMFPPMNMMGVPFPMMGPGGMNMMGPGGMNMMGMNNPWDNGGDFFHGGEEFVNNKIDHRGDKRNNESVGKDFSQRKRSDNDVNYRDNYNNRDGKKSKYSHDNEKQSFNNTNVNINSNNSNNNKYNDQREYDHRNRSRYDQQDSSKRYDNKEDIGRDYNSKRNDYKFDDRQSNNNNSYKESSRKRSRSKSIEGKSYRGSSRGRERDRKK